MANQEIGEIQPENQVANIFPPVIELLGDDTFFSSKVALQYQKIRETSGEGTTEVTVLLNGRPWPYISFGQNPLKKGTIHQFSITSLPKENVNVSIIAENRHTTSAPATLSLRYGKPTVPSEFRGIAYRELELLRWTGGSKETSRA